jgi:type I restriction enzyme S subunit
MKQYDSYKESGIEWIGEIPEHWEVKKLKHLFDIIPSNVDKKSKEDETKVLLCNYVDVYKNDKISFDLNFMVASASATQIDKLTLKQFDVIATKDSEDPNDIGIPALVLDNMNGVVCGYHLTLFRSKQSEILGKYLFWFLKSKMCSQYFSTLARGITRYALGTSAFSNLPLFSIGDINEVSAIVNYLDYKTIQIDTLISKKQQFITLLQEERIAVINQAVTKGLDPKVKMKDSGIEWLGEIPEHWDVKPLKYLVKDLLSGVSVNSHDVPATNNEDLGILKTSCVYDYTFRPMQNKQVLKEEYNRVKCSVGKDTIIISRMNTPELVGASGYVSKDYPNLFLPDRLWKTEFFNDVKINVKWLSQVLISDLYKKALSSRATGTSPSMKNISKADFLTLQVPYPILGEQTEIAKFLLKESSRVDETIIKAKQEIELLEEYKTALISEVVTGKVDLRDVVLN